MKDLRHIQERQQVTFSRRDATQALLQQRRLEFEQLLHPVQTEALEEAADAKQEFLEDLRERDEALGTLEENTYQPPETIPQTAPNAVDAARDAAAAARLEREYAELMGETPETPEPAVPNGRETPAQVPEEIA